MEMVGFKGVRLLRNEGMKLELKQLGIIESEKKD